MFDVESTQNRRTFLRQLAKSSSGIGDRIGAGDAVGGEHGGLCLLLLEHEQLRRVLPKRPTDVVP